MKMDNQKNANIMIKATVLSAIILIFLCFIVIFYVAFSGDNTSEIQENGERYGTSDFYKYKDKIYALVYGNGLLEVEGVDIPTFKVFDTEDNNGNVAYDKNRVYFGNIAVSDLDTDKLYYVGNNYYSDGTNSYFCSTSSEYNEELSAKSTIIQNISHFFFKTKRPQHYFYPYKKLETNKRLEKVEELKNSATDGEEVYYAGEKLVNADIYTIKTIEDALFYFADKENVYYHSKLLPIKNSGNLKVISLNPDDKFLYDEINGYVLIGDYSFDKEKAPYKIIGSNGTHLYSLIFVSDDGIYFYDSENKKQVRLKDNIFVGNIEEISSNVFTDNENIYYFQNYEIWKKYKNRGNILVSRNTEVYSLGKKESWKKLADIGNEKIGSLWQKDNEYYYFDNLENSSSKVDYRSTIYKITDKSTLESLLFYPEYINVEKIDEFILNKNFEDAKGEKLFTATIKFHNVLKIFLGVLLVLGFIFIVFFLYLNKLNKEDKKNIDKMLLEKYRNIKPLSKNYNDKE